MNVISNDCLGAYVYKDKLKCEFMNPFIWSSMDLPNFINLIELYDDLDFYNMKCELVLNNSKICKQNSYTPKITIDNKVEVNYFHYIQDERFKTPTKSSGYTLYDDIVNYTVEAYVKRLSKMTETPIFVWDSTMCVWYNKLGTDIFTSFSKIKTKRDIIIYSVDVEDKKINNLTLLNKTNGSFEVNISANNVFEKVLKKI